MKKSLLFIAGLSATLAFGQKITNATESKYEFTKVAHLDATPVENQGYTGTCWSFSALSFFESELIRMGIKQPELLSQPSPLSLFNL